MEAQIEVEADGYWEVGLVVDALISGELEIIFHHPDEVRELIEAAEHLLTKMEGDDDGS